MSKNACSRCGTDVDYEGTEDLGSLLCDECQDHKDAQEHWHKEYVDDMFKYEDMADDW